MIKIKTKKILAIALACSLASSNFSAFAQTAPAPEASLCQQVDGYTIGFFNGVLNTPTDARNSVDELIAQEYENRFQMPEGQSINYEQFYNSTKGWRDFVEVFEQRVLQQDELLKDRWELFLMNLNGNSSTTGTSWKDKLASIASSTGDLFNAFGDYILTKLPTAMAQAVGLDKLASIVIGSETESAWQTQTEQRQRVSSTIAEGRKLLMLAHSQGNLFVHDAYKSALKLTTADSVKVVHVASASPFLHGPHILADKDIVIGGLNLLFTNSTSPIVIPGHPDRVKLGSDDWKGHSFVDIYMHSALPLRNIVNQHVVDALIAIKPPVRIAQPGLFTVTLEWNGTGDVDLHTYEPNGNKVYYNAKQGRSGRLDVDNIIANGPEHFYADCRNEMVMEGDYRIGIANYNSADGRLATVQISSWDKGVLGTKSITLGGSTGSKTGYELFTVSVKRDLETGKVHVTQSGT